MTTRFLGWAEGIGRAIPAIRITGLLVVSLGAMQGQNVFPTSGNVGIGTTAPSFQLDVANSTRIYSQLQISGGNSVGWPLFGFNTVYDGNGGGGWRTTFTGYPGAIGVMQDTGRMAFLTNGGLVGAGAAHALSERMDISPGGNVGIGTSAPRGTGYQPTGWLDLAGGLFIGNGANVGGTSFASSTTWAPNGGLMAWNKMSGAGEMDLINLSGTGYDGGYAFYDRDAQLMRITKAGYVGIGTSTPAHLLHVAGTIGAEEVIVSSTGADYVFESGYKLKPLNEVAIYIEENHHLPDIPSAKEGKQNGVGLGEMQSKLLAKIEELTLHMIAAERRSTGLEKENRELLVRDRDMQERIDRLEKAGALK